MPVDALETLGLDGTADERAIRKAYARALKAQDLAEDPESFQRLREAYERALAWVRKPDSLPAEDGRPPEPQAFEAPPSAPPEGPSLPERAGDVVFEGFLSELEALPFYPGVPFIQQHLQRCWLDSRMVAIGARERFEFRVATLLVDEFCPFEKVLLPAAMLFFDWARDRRRLDRFEAVGKGLNDLIDRYGVPLPAPVAGPRTPLSAHRAGSSVDSNLSRLAWRVGISVHGCKEGVVLALALLFIASLRDNLGHGPTALPSGIHMAIHVGLAAGLTWLGAGIGRWFALRAARRHFRNWGLYALGAWPVLVLAGVGLDAGAHAGLSLFFREAAMGRWEAFLLGLDPGWGPAGVTMALASFTHLYLFKDHCAV